MTWTEPYFSALKGARTIDPGIGEGGVPVLIIQLPGERHNPLFSRRGLVLTPSD